MYFGLFGYFFISYFPYQNCSARGFRGVSFPLFPLTNSQTQWKFARIYYKRIPLCSCVCFKGSLKTSENLKLLIPPCGALYLVKTSKVLVQFSEQKFIGDCNPLVLRLCKYNIFIALGVVINFHIKLSLNHTLLLLNNFWCNISVQNCRSQKFVCNVSFS